VAITAAKTPEAQIGYGTAELMPRPAATTA